MKSGEGNIIKYTANDEEVTMDTYELVDKEAMEKAFATMSSRFSRMFGGLIHDLGTDGKVSVEDSAASARELLKQFEQHGIVKKV